MRQSHRQPLFRYTRDMTSISDILNTKMPRLGTRRTVLWLWHALRGNRLQAGLNAATGLAGVAVSLASVWSVQRAIDIASGARAGSLYWAVGLMALFIACDFGLDICHVWIRNILGIKARNHMQQRMVDRLLHSEWSGRERYHSGDVINRLEQDVATVADFVTETLPNALSVAAMFVGAFLYLLHMDAVLAIATVAILPLFMLLSRIYVVRMRKFTRRVRRCDSRVQGLLQDAVQHRMLIKTLECAAVMVSRLDAGQASLRRHVRRRTVFSVLSNLMVNAGFSIGYLVAFLWSAVRLSHGAITFGGMTAFLQLVYRIQTPARDLAKLVPAFVAAVTAAERLMELEDMPCDDCDSPQPLDMPCGVRLTGVTYAYGDGKRNVIDNLSFDFRPGTCTAILGKTGAGKTTLIRLMLALVRPQGGRIELYNARESVDVTAGSRCNFVYVPQGNTLLNGTIRSNLLLGNPSATEADMEKALRMACADFALTLPDGIDTAIGEDGGGISEGQAQRIAIARALLRDRGVMLFDEATSALDPATERMLLHNILGSRDKTVIFITHRAAVMEYCDSALRLG